MNQQGADFLQDKYFYFENLINNRLLLHFYLNVSSMYRPEDFYLRMTCLCTILNPTHFYFNADVDAYQKI